VNSAALLSSYFAIRRKLSYWKQTVSQNKPAPRQALKNICHEVANLIAVEQTDLEKTTIIRNWVNQNSIHLVDQEHDSYAFDLSKVLVKAWDYSASASHRPHLSCGPRAYLLKAVLDKLQYRTRIIDIFEIIDGKPRSHTLIEYFDSTLGKWIMQDPDFNVYYISTRTKEPLGAGESLLIDSSGMWYESSGFEVENLVNLTETIRDYFTIVVVYRYGYVGGRAKIRLSEVAETYALARGMVLDIFHAYLDTRYTKG